jgi:hypothetical protein
LIARAAGKRARIAAIFAAAADVVAGPSGLASRSPEDPAVSREQAAGVTARAAAPASNHAQRRPEEARTKEGVRTICLSLAGREGDPDERRR